MTTKKKPKTELLTVNTGQEIYTGRPLNEVIQSQDTPFLYDAYTGKSKIKAGQVVITTLDKELKSLNADDIAVFIYIIHKVCEIKDGYTVNIDIGEYARAGGYDIDNPDKRLAKQNRDIFSKRFRASLNNLRSLSLFWKTLNGVEKDRQIIIGTDRHKGQYAIQIHQELIQELTKNHFVRSLPKNAMILRPGDNGKKNRNYTKVLYWLATYYGFASNREQGRNNIISVKSLLEWTSLPTIEDLERTNHRNYNNRIIEPLEELLDDMRDKGDIKEWYFCKAKKERYTDEELKTVRGKELINTGFIYFEMNTTNNIKG